MGWRRGCDPHCDVTVLNNMNNHQTSQMAFNDIFFLLGWIFLAIITFLWLAKPPFGAGAGAASAGGH